MKTTTARFNIKPSAGISLNFSLYLVCCIIVSANAFYLAVLWNVVKIHTAHLQLITFSLLLTKVIACSPEPHLLYASGKKHLTVKNCYSETFFALACAVYLIELVDIHTEYTQNKFESV